MLDISSECGPRILSWDWMAAWGIYKCTHGWGANMTSLHIASAFRYGTKRKRNGPQDRAFTQRAYFDACIVLSRPICAFMHLTGIPAVEKYPNENRSWASRGARGKELDGPDYDLERSPMREACWTMSRRKIMSNTSVQPSTPEFAAVVTSH